MLEQQKVTDYSIPFVLKETFRLISASILHSRRLSLSKDPNYHPSIAISNTYTLGIQLVAQTHLQTDPLALRRSLD